MVVIVRIEGGLGNQLFQYAAGRALALKKQCPLIIDDWQFHANKTVLKYRLDQFNIRGERPGFAEFLRIRLIDSKKLRRPQNWLRGVAPGMLPTVLRDAEKGFDESVLQHPGSVYLAGFWQTEKYFAAARDAILDDLQFRDPPDAANRQMLERIGQGDSVCVHIRRGDYVSHPVYSVQHGTCDLSYYEAAFAHLSPRLKSPTFFVFSDDPDWTKTNLRPPGETVYVTQNVGKHDHEDIRLMSACKYFIIANSTFSWWGAWLAQNPDKIVIAPRRWYAAGHGSEKDIVPETWLRM